MKTETKNVVIVFNGDVCITDVLRDVVLKTGAASDVTAAISAIGFADPSQIREIVKIIDRPKTLTQ